MSRRHQQETSEFVGTGGDPLYRATCSCGWRSDLLPPMRVQVAWEEHVDDAKRRAEA